MNSSRDSPKSISSVSMEDDALAVIMQQGRAEQEKIEELIEKLYDSDASSLSKSHSQSSSPKGKTRKAKAEDRDIKIQYRIAHQMRLYTENTAIRAIKYMRELADPQTVLLKSYVQHLIYTGGNPIHPETFCRGIENPRLSSPEQYYVWGNQDNFAVYFLALLTIYGMYRDSLRQAGQLHAFLTNALEHLLPMMNNVTGFFQDYLGFVESTKDTIELVGLSAKDMHNDLLLKIITEWESLFNVLTQLPMNIAVAGSIRRRLAFLDVMAEVPTYMQQSPQIEAFRQIKTELDAVEASVRATVGLPTYGGASRGGARSRAHPGSFGFRIIPLFAAAKSKKKTNSNSK